MSSKTATIVDKEGDVWTGRVESRSPGITDLLVGIACPAAMPGMLSSSNKITVVVNGEKHTGKKI